MKVIYDRKTDIMTVILGDAPVDESDEDKPGVILDYDTSGNLVSLEILDASRRIKTPGQIEYQVVPLEAKRKKCRYAFLSVGFRRAFRPLRKG